MTNREVFELLSQFENSSIHTMKLSDGSFSLELSKAPAACRRDSGAYARVPQNAAADTPAKSETEKDGGTCLIAAPLAGVFYEASQPGAKPYVAVGDRVKAGQTVCLMEAMKMISEIPAPCDCIITAILKENGKLAAYDEPLIRYQPC